MSWIEPKRAPAVDVGATVDPPCAFYMIQVISEPQLDIDSRRFYHLYTEDRM